ncbi:MAG: XrtA system polysaccharide deacetylase [Pseudomonadota bacterium]
MHSPSSIDNSIREAQSPIVNGMSVDVEDWFQVGAFENVISRDDWDDVSCRVESNIDRVLDLFEKAGVKSTFFTLGWMAERHPIMIRRIADKGHELASHGYDHARVFTLDRASFSADISKARQLIEDASGRKVTGYRAPSFSIDKSNPWAFEVLAEHGYDYSSSVAPLVHDHYGWPEAPRFAFNPVPGSPLVEIPVTTALFGNRRLAAGGGGFFRVLPYGFSRWAIRQVNQEEARPAMFYFHPWEVDPEQPRVDNAPMRSKLRHYTNLKQMAGKLTRLSNEFAWGCCNEVARREALRAEPFHVMAEAGEQAA